MRRLGLFWRCQGSYSSGGAALDAGKTTTEGAVRLLNMSYNRLARTVLAGTSENMSRMALIACLMNSSVL